jgi:hypothetical protein
VESDHAGNTLTNHGVIHGAAGSNSSAGGGGGVGVNFTLGAMLTNTGSISGGVGGAGSAAAGGVGGAGANVITGTLNNTGSITGGTGGIGTTAGGGGGPGVFLNGGTLITAGTVSGGGGGSGAPPGAAGDAVKFGSTASTLVVEPGAVFNGQVIANNVHDILELAGIQSGGTTVTLGTQFTNFATLEFAAGAHWTADATVSDLNHHLLTVDGFTSSDKLDVTNLAAAGATLKFNTATEILTITKGATTISLQFNSAFSGQHFVISADGHGGSNIHLQSGAAPTLTAAAHDILNFVGEAHRAMMGHASMPILGAHGAGSSFGFQSDAPLSALSAHGFADSAFIQHGFAHADMMLK